MITMVCFNELFGKTSDGIYFDDVDFYCFVEYFDSKQINKLFSKHSIETLEFKNMQSIETSVDKLCSYYEQIIKEKRYIEIFYIENKIKCCLNLLRYINISQELVDFVCSFVFKYEFRDISISDKILFLDSQLWKRKMYSETTANIIENKLVYYIDKHIEAIVNGAEFNLYSTSDINYHNLINYIVENRDLKSRKIAYRISKIVNNSYSQLKKDVIWYYYTYLSNLQQKKIIKWVHDDLIRKFDFDSFVFLVNYDIKIDKKIIQELKKYLKNQLEISKKNTTIITYPKHDPLESLNLVGYFCRTGALRKRDFSSFVNNSSMFDLFYKFEKFDFKNFDVVWLLQWQEKMILTLSENKIVKNKVRNCIVEEMNASQLQDNDLKKLSKILTKYFC